MTRPTQKSRFNVFAKSDTSNLPEADNRGIYLVIFIYLYISYYIFNFKIKL